MIDEALLRHLYRYDRSLPLLGTSDREPCRDPETRQPIEGLEAERVSFGSTHDERVVATVTRPTEGGAVPGPDHPARLDADGTP